MKKPQLILIILMAIGITLVFVGRQTLNAKINDPEPVDTVFLGDKHDKLTFEKSIKSAKVFSNLFREGLNNKKIENYIVAIKLFNECLPYAELGPEVAMVYEQLAEIYRLQNNPEKELFYIEEWPKYTMSNREKKECAERAVYLRSILFGKIKNREVAG